MSSGMQVPHQAYVTVFLQYTVSFLKERQFWSSDAVKSISLLRLIVALLRESHSWEIELDLKISRSLKTP